MSSSTVRATSKASSALTWASLMCSRRNARIWSSISPGESSAKCDSNGSIC